VATGTSKLLRVGILGAGGIARARHVPGYQLSGVAAVTAVYDLVRVNAERLAEQSGARVFETPEELFARDDIDAVSICTPNLYHAPLSLAAIRTGKHVLCEKPLGMTYQETVEMDAAAREAGVTTAVNFRYRYLPAVQLLKQKVVAGDLGRPYHLLFHYLQGHMIDPQTPMSWRLDRSITGSGTLGDLASHGVDLVRYLLGEVAAVFADLTTFVQERPLRGGGAAPVEVDDSATLLLRMRNGAIVTIASTRNAGGRKNFQRLDLYGSGGSAYYEMDQDDIGADILHTWKPAGGDFHPVAVPATLPQSNMQIIMEFARAALSGQQTVPNFTDGMRCQEILEAAERSSGTGSRVSLPLDTTP